MYPDTRKVRRTWPEGACGVGTVSGQLAQEGEARGWGEHGLGGAWRFGARAGTGGACQQAGAGFYSQDSGELPSASSLAHAVCFSCTFPHFLCPVPPSFLLGREWRTGSLLRCWQSSSKKEGRGVGMGSQLCCPQKGPTWLAGGLRKALDVRPASLRWETWGWGMCRACHGVPGPPASLRTDPPDGCPSESPSRISPFISLVASGIGSAMDM